MGESCAVRAEIGAGACVLLVVGLPCGVSVAVFASEKSVRVKAKRIRPVTRTVPFGSATDCGFLQKCAAVTGRNRLMVVFSSLSKKKGASLAFPRKRSFTTESGAKTGGVLQVWKIF